MFIFLQQLNGLRKGLEDIYFMRRDMIILGLQKRC